MNNSKIISIMSENSTVQAMQKINDLHDLEVPQMLADVGVMLDDKRFSNKLSKPRRNFLIAIRSSLAKKSSRLKVDFEEHPCDIHSYKSPLSVEMFQSICLPNSWEVVIDVGPEHKYFRNTDTQTIVQFHKGTVVYMQFDSSFLYWQKLAECMNTQLGIKAAQYSAL